MTASVDRSSFDQRVDSSPEIFPGQAQKRHLFEPISGWRVSARRLAPPFVEKFLSKGRIRQAGARETRWPAALFSERNGFTRRKNRATCW